MNSGFHCGLQYACVRAPRHPPTPTPPSTGARMTQKLRRLIKRCVHRRDHHHTSKSRCSRRHSYRCPQENQIHSVEERMLGPALNTPNLQSWREMRQGNIGIGAGSEPKCVLLVCGCVGRVANPYAWAHPASCPSLIVELSCER
jgi:hypothetical protein